MKCELISNKAKAAEPPEARSERYEFGPVEGSTVCYHQPLYEQPLRQLNDAIHRGDSLQKLQGRYYKIQSNGGYLHQHYPAVEYYKIAYRMIRDNIHTIVLARKEMEENQKAIEEIYATRRETLPSGQTKLSFDREVYQLRASLTTYVFSVRATLDTFATIFQTIYGPRIGQHTSFNKLKNHVLSGNCAINDPVLAEFLRDEMEWFILLKDVRDYLAHFGAIHFAIKENSPGVLSIEMFKGMEIDKFVEAVEGGFSRLLEFLDAHCSEVARGA